MSIRPAYTRVYRQLPELWEAAKLAERRRLLLTILDAVYVDPRERPVRITIRPNAAFAAVLPVADSAATVV